MKCSLETVSQKVPAKASAERLLRCYKSGSILVRWMWFVVFMLMTYPEDAEQNVRARKQIPAVGMTFLSLI